MLPGAENYADDIEQCWLDATNATGVDGIERKLQEMRYAIQIEKDYSKNEILLGYLNIASFGGTVYGIEAAANYYFSTTAAKLTVAQAATLAGIVQNPEHVPHRQGRRYDDRQGRQRRQLGGRRVQPHPEAPRLCARPHARRRQDHSGAVR